MLEWIKKGFYTSLGGFDYKRKGRRAGKGND